MSLSALPEGRRTLRVVTVALTALVIAPLLPAADGLAAPQPVPPTVGAEIRMTPAPQAARLSLGGKPVTRTSLPVQTPIAFSMVGFTVPRGASMRFRTSEDGRRWSGWRDPAEEADTEDTPDADSAEMRRALAARPATLRMTEALWVGQARFLQTKVTGRDANANPAKAVAHLVDATGLNRGAAGRLADRLSASWRGLDQAPEAHAAAGMPRIVTRRQWGADESLRRGKPGYASRLVAGTVHHTAGSNTYTQAQAPAVVRGAYYFHTRTRGWSDLGTTSSSTASAPSTRAATAGSPAMSSAPTPEASTPAPPASRSSATSRTPPRPPPCAAR